MPGIPFGILITTLLWLRPSPPGPAMPSGSSDLLETHSMVSAGPLHCLYDKTIYFNPNWHDLRSRPQVRGASVYDPRESAAPALGVPDTASATCDVRPLPGNPLPAYPALLRSAHVDGLVVVQFVVDTVGQVDPSSIGIERSTHELFSKAVFDALLRSKYRPSHARGRRERQLVEQRFTFALLP